MVRGARSVVSTHRCRVLIIGMKFWASRGGGCYIFDADCSDPNFLSTFVRLGTGLAHVGVLNAVSMACSCGLWPDFWTAGIKIRQAGGHASTFHEGGVLVHPSRRQGNSQISINGSTLQADSPDNALRMAARIRAEAMAAAWHETGRLAWEPSHFCLHDSRVDKLRVSPEIHRVIRDSLCLNFVKNEQPMQDRRRDEASRRFTVARCVAHRARDRVAP